MKLFASIFLIDDENLCNFITSKILEKAGIADQIESFLSAGQALTRIKNDHQDQHELHHLILLDINMPGMDGWGFLDEFEKLPESVRGQYKVMMLTSSIDNRDIEKSKTYKSVERFISKPFSIEKLDLNSPKA